MPQKTLKMWQVSENQWQAENQFNNRNRHQVYITNSTKLLADLIVFVFYPDFKFVGIYAKYSCDLNSHVLKS